MHGLKGVRRFVNTAQARTIVTAFYYSILFYGCEIWFHKHLSFHLKQKIKSGHYRALRLIRGNLSRDELNEISQRSTPEEWADYSLAKMVSRMVLANCPRRLLDGTIMNAYSERRQDGLIFFFDSSKRKIRQQFKNRLSMVSKQMKFKWLRFSINALRPNLKKCFLSYAKTKRD
jgi:hypothetical protein